MKKIIWKLFFNKENNTYTVEYRLLGAIPYLLILSPILIISYLLGNLYKILMSPFKINEKTIQVREEVKDKKVKDAILKTLTET